MRRIKRGGWPYSQPPNTQFEINRASPQAKRLVAWWPTLASRGTNMLRDLSGYGMDGALSAGTVIAPYPVVGAGIVWDGGVRTATMADAPHYQNLPLVDFSLSWWYLADNAIGAVSQQVWAKTALNIGWQAQLRLQAGTLRSRFFVYYDDTDAFANTGAGLLTDGLWHHMGMRFDSSLKRIHLYINGVEATYENHVDGIGNYDADAGQSIIIGANGLDGAGADFRVYNRPLFDTDVLQSYTEPWELYKPLIRRWIGWKSPITARIPRYGFTNFQVPGIV